LSKEKGGMSVSEDLLSNRIDFMLIYKKYYDRVYHTAIRITRDPHLAEDVMQETFIKAYYKMDTILDLEKVGSWITTIASRTAIDFIRREKRGCILTVDDRFIYEKYESIKACVFNVEQEMEAHWLEEEIKHEVEQLSPSLKDVFQLSYLKGLKEEEIALHLQLTKGKVKSRLHRARQQIKNRLRLNNERVESA
jgi:RNA polymerase sigma factor (sigma-70 family)